MFPHDHEKLTRLYLRAATLRPGRRERFLDRVCRDDAGLREEIESLLLHCSNTPTLLQRGNLAVLSREIIATPERIGPYRIIEKIGEGGMGVVYRAEQEEPIRRQVALKLIKLGFETEKVVARFNSERRVLALMDHPNIARVLDAGVTSQGRPYFAMEHVAGEPITRFCDRRRLDLGDRLALFLQVCDAVHHAHQNSIIHRDIKPSNVLVGGSNGDAIPKVIDFGIAKALARDASEGSTLTEAGQLMGTPEYMSPEQATSSVRNIDIRTDVYSLGALLYELLVGVPPFDSDLLRNRDAEHVRRSIQEEEPLRPSARVLACGDAGTAIAGARRTSKSSLTRRLRGDLDCIVMKALARERCRRYGSASDLAADVRRHLGNDPIEARPASPTYRIGRFARKHRTAVAVVGALIPLLLVSSIGLTVQAQRNARQRDRAEELSELLTGFYEAPFFVAGRHARPPAGAILWRSAQRIERELTDRPLLQARLSHAMGVSLCGAGEIERGMALLERAHGRLQELLGAGHPRTLAAKHDLAQGYAESGRTEKAERLFLDVLAARRSVLGDDHLESLRTMSALGYLYKMSGRNAKAAPLLAEALDGMRVRLGEDEPETTTVAGILASVYLDLRRLDEAEALLAEVLPLMDEHHIERPMALYNRACVHALRGERGEALDWLRRATEAGFLIPFFSDPNVRSLHEDPEFVSIVKRALLRDRLVLAEQRERVRGFLIDGRGEEAEDLLRHVIQHDPPVPAAELLLHMGRLAELYQRQGRHDEALRVGEALLDLKRREFGADHQNVALVHWFLMQAHLAAGRADRALRSLRECLSIFQRGSDDSYFRCWIPYLEADREALRGNREAALRGLTEAVELGYPHPEVMRQDLALRGLRELSAFEAIVAKLSYRFEYP